MPSCATWYIVLCLRLGSLKQESQAGFVLFGGIITSYYINKYPTNPECLCAYWASPMQCKRPLNQQICSTQHQGIINLADSIKWIVGAATDGEALVNEFVADAIDSMLRSLDNSYRQEIDAATRSCPKDTVLEHYLHNSRGLRTRNFQCRCPLPFAHHLRQEDKSTMLCRFMTCTGCLNFSTVDALAVSDNWVCLCSEYPNWAGWSWILPRLLKGWVQKVAPPEETSKNLRFGAGNLTTEAAFVAWTS